MNNASERLLPRGGTGTVLFLRFVLACLFVFRDASIKRAYVSHIYA